MKRQHGVDGFVVRPSYMQVLNHMKQGFPANENVPYPDIKYQTAEAGFINSQKFEIQPNLVGSQTAAPLAGTWAGTPPPIHVHATFMDPPRGGGGRRARRGVVHASSPLDGWDGDTPDQPDLRSVGVEAVARHNNMLEEMAASGGPYDPYANGLATSENRQGGIHLHLHEQFEDPMDADEVMLQRRPEGWGNQIWQGVSQGAVGAYGRARDAVANQAGQAVLGAMAGSVVGQRVAGALDRVQRGGRNALDLAAVRAQDAASRGMQGLMRGVRGVPDVARRNAIAAGELGEELVPLLQLQRGLVAAGAEAAAAAGPAEAGMGLAGMIAGGAAYEVAFGAMPAIMASGGAGLLAGAAAFTAYKGWQTMMERRQAGLGDFRDQNASEELRTLQHGQAGDHPSLPWHNPSRPMPLQDSSGTRQSHWESALGLPAGEAGLAMYPQEHVQVRPHSQPSNSDAAVDAHLRDLIAANQQELRGTRSSSSSGSGTVKITRRSMSFWETKSDDVLRTQIALRGVAQSTLARWSREELLDHIATMISMEEW